MGELAISVAANLEAERTTTERTKRGIRFPRYFTNGKVSPYDEMTWERRTASIGNSSGKMVFEQADVEVPTDWSQTATNIVASKYFYAKPKSFEREASLRQLIRRVVHNIAGCGH